MKTTPNFGFQVAEPTDPVKQYPTAVDDPFKATLDTLLHPAVKDTGWRNISGLLTNGWSVSSGYVHIRRVGAAVNLRAYSIIAPSTFNGTWINPIPGFMATAYGIPVTTPTAVLTNTYLYVHPTNGFVFAGTVAAAAVLRLNAVYLTDDAWPGSLPGSPVVLGALRDAIDDMTDPMPAGES